MQKSKDLQKLHASYAALLASFKNHNIETAQKSINSIKDLETDFWSNVDSYLEIADAELQALQSQYTSNASYLQELKTALSDRGIPCDQHENNLIIGPMQVLVNVEEYQLQLIMGRKKKRISDLELTKVVKLIEQTYKKLNYSFNANTFFKRLLRAYEYASAKMYGTKDTKYGYAVSLKVLFDLFTIAPGSNDYKIENFLWDLGRLLDAMENLGQYRVELGFARDVRSMFIIKTAGGESIKASSVTIHTEG